MCVCCVLYSALCLFLLAHCTSFSWYTSPLYQFFLYSMQYKGNLVSLAVAEAVLRVVEEEGLVAHARELGGYILSQLSLLANKHPCIGDVRSVHPLEETLGYFAVTEAVC